MRYSKVIKGLSCDLRFMRFYKGNIDIRISKDKLGTTMSVADGERMITIPLEAVKDILEVKENESKKERY